MRYRIRKGLESPCMIRGLLSGDYWIFVGCCSAAFVLFFLGIRAVIHQMRQNDKERLHIADPAGDFPVAPE